MPHFPEVSKLLCGLTIQLESLRGSNVGGDKHAVLDYEGQGTLSIKVEDGGDKKTYLYPASDPFNEWCALEQMKTLRTLRSGYTLLEVVMALALITGLASLCAFFVPSLFLLDMRWSLWYGVVGSVVVIVGAHKWHDRWSREVASTYVSKVLRCWERYEAIDS